MWKLNVKQLLTLLLLCCMVFTSAMPVAAKSAPPANPDDTQVKTYLQETQSYENAIRDMERYIYVTKAGTLALNDAFPISIARSNVIYSELLDSLAKTNQMLESGEMKLSEVDLTSFDDNEIDQKGDGSTAAKGCAGANTKKTKWWGIRFNFDSCKVRNVLQAVAAGLGVGAIIAVVGFSVAFVVVIPILIVEVGVVTALAALGGFDKGMYFALTWVGVHWWGIQ